MQESRICGTRQVAANKEMSQIIGKTRKFSNAHAPSYSSSGQESCAAEARRSDHIARHRKDAPTACRSDLARARSRCPHLKYIENARRFRSSRPVHARTHRRARCSLSHERALASEARSALRASRQRANRLFQALSRAGRFEARPRCPRGHGLVATPGARPASARLARSARGGTMSHARPISPSARTSRYVTSSSHQRCRTVQQAGSE